MADRKLARPVHVGGVAYAAGTAEGDIDGEHLKLITNEKAWDAEAAGTTGNVGVGPTQNFVAVENPLPRATAPKEDKDDAKTAPSPAKSAPGKPARS
jgi:hypothetical protein